MDRKTKKIDDLLTELDSLLDDRDSLMVFMLDGKTREAMSMLMSKNKEELVGAICERMESGDQIGKDMIDLFSSIIIGFSRAHPEFATVFIRYFNKIVYGLKDFNPQKPN